MNLKHRYALQKSARRDRDVELKIQVEAILSIVGKFGPGIV